ncbi:MAG: phosphotransferase [Chloroflexi bacterium]|nr:phosphotransferase [Chloroflexota bacterium]
MTLTLEQALARVPMWRGVRDLKTALLGGGITNQNIRVDVGGESFVLRIGGADTELLGINRQHEYAANVAAARIGIAPEPEGYLVTRFLNARPIPRDEMQKPENIRRVARALNQIHALPAIPGTFSPFRAVERYAATARKYKVAFPKNFEWLTARVHEIEAAFLKVPFTACPCHNDLLNENFLDDGNIRILDWEYAGMGDVAFDLANFAVHHQLNDEQERILLEEYYSPSTLGKGLGVRSARHKLMKIASDMREAMWGMVQIGISKLDFDFRGYTEKHFARAEGMMRDARYAEWLGAFAEQ